MIQSLLNPAKIKGSDMSYKYLTLEERYNIQAYKSRGYKNKEIEKQLGVHPSTIGREIQRNKGNVSLPLSRTSLNRIYYSPRLEARDL